MLLERPTPLVPRSVASPAGLLAGGIGLAALAIGMWSQFGGGRAVPSLGSMALFGPMLGLAGAAAGVAFWRRERLWVVAVAGVAMALAAPVAGWLVIVGAVAAVALTAMLIIAKFH